MYAYPELVSLRWRRAGCFGLGLRAACDGAFTATGEGVEWVRHLKHAMERRGRAMQMARRSASLVLLFQTVNRFTLILMTRE